MGCGGEGVHRLLFIKVQIDRDLASVCRHQCLDKLLAREVFLVLQTKAQKDFLAGRRS